MSRLLPFLGLLVLAILGNTPPSLSTDPQALIDASIAAHGGDLFERSVVSFDFRGKHFRIERKGGMYTIERTYEDDGEHVREVLNNEGVFREEGGDRVILAPWTRRTVEREVNSVAYFAQLPYKLNDPAVRKAYLGEATINGEAYHKIEVTFAEEGGGRNPELRFVYWIHQTRHTLDYLAYTSDDGRFRAAYNPRIIEGLRFVDYVNYRAKYTDDRIQDNDAPYAAGDLEELSRIELENVQVTVLPQN